MDKKQIQLKQELDSYISAHKIFTEKDKKNIRIKIKEARFQREKRVRGVRMAPILATCAAGFLFFLLTSTFVGDKITSVFQKPQSNEVNIVAPDPESKVRDGAEQTRPIIDPNTVKEGDRISEFVVGTVFPNVDQNPEFFSAYLEGEVALDGELDVLTIGGRTYAVFYPDEKSLLKIPIVAGIEREPFIILHSHLNLVQFLQLDPGDKEKAQIKIEHYRIIQNPKLKEQSYDYARLLTVDGDILPDDINPDVVTKEYQILREGLVPLYEKFVANREESDLKGLEPLDVYELYWQAFEYGNLEIKYFLLEGTDLPDYQTFTEKIIEKNFEKEQKIFEKVKGSQNLDIVVEGNQAYVVIDENSGEKFELMKNSSGIWKVKFLP